MPNSKQIIEKIIQKAIKEWSEQGRTKEQIYGVKNFMSGKGFMMANSLYHEGFKDGLSEALKLVRKFKQK